MKHIFILLILAGCFLFVGEYKVNSALLKDFPVNERTINQPPVKSEFQVAQRRSGGGYWNNNNFYRQQQLQQQRLLQQQRQRQQMEQQRRQQALQRQRMQEQRRRQQQAMRQRQQQMAVQRQRMLEQRRLVQNRQRQELQRRQGERQAAQRQVQQTQRLARQQVQDQKRLRHLRELRARDRRVKSQKEQQKQRDLAVIAILRNARGVAALKSPAANRSLTSAKANLRKIRKQREQLNPQKETASKAATEKAQKVAALRKKIACVGGPCKCSFHGDTLIKTQRGLVAIRNIEAGVDYVWAKDELTGISDWKKVKYQYSNWYDQSVEISVKGREGVTQKIVSNRIHPFYTQTVSQLRPFESSSENNLKILIHHNGSNRLNSPQGEGGWRPASDLQPNDRLLNANGEWSHVVSVETKSMRFKAFNLTVSDFHTYFIAANDNAVPVWVHNDCNIKKVKKELKKTKLKVEKNSSANSSLKIRTVKNLKGGPLENATQTSGKFKLEKGPPRGTLYRADPKGNITSYATYDKFGKILKRVDVRGKAHKNVKTPHVIEYGRNTMPNGVVRVHTPRIDPRPARPDELP